MIAPAMNTRPQEALSYRDLARQQAQISRQIGLEALPRLKDLCDELCDELAEELGDDADAAEVGPESAGFAVVLRFSIDERGFSRVEGELSGRLFLNCNGCAEVLAHPLTLSFSCVIAETEAIAESLVEESRVGGEILLSEDVLVANGTEVTVAQIVEDEILLNLPERLCTSEPCERAPGLAYPAGESAQSNAEADEDAGGDSEDKENPFSVLAGLKLGGTQNDD